ncbi:unnamed protein product [Owenia fusiformis]|uniref:Uncharacterized protein n=1 Tax=Owenia fusiformis TaxID=6347 RepID=A0A8S4P5X2_OWEFU|nr:unnamed protein product [Owenia fusiformis]
MACSNNDHEYSDSSAGEDETQSQIPSAQRTWDKLFETLQELPKDVYIERLLSLCEHSNLSIDGFRDYLLIRARMERSETPKFKLIARKGGRSEDRKSKLASDCYALYQFTEGNSVADLMSIFTKTPIVDNEHTSRFARSFISNDDVCDPDSINQHSQPTTSTHFSMMETMMSYIFTIKGTCAEISQTLELQNAEIKDLQKQIKQYKQSEQTIRDCEAKAKNELKHVKLLLKEREHEVSEFKSKMQSYENDVKQRLNALEGKVGTVHKNVNELKDTYSRKRFVSAANQHETMDATDPTSPVPDICTSPSDHNSMSSSPQQKTTNSSAKQSPVNADTTKERGDNMAKPDSSNRVRTTPTTSEGKRIPSSPCEHSFCLAATTKVNTIPVVTSYRQEFNNAAVTNNDDEDEDDIGFSGYQRPRNRRQNIKRLFVSRLRSKLPFGDLSKKIQSFALSKGVTITFVRLLKTYTSNFGLTHSYSLRINVLAQHSHSVLDDQHFWPDGVLCKEWIPNYKSNTEQDNSWE